MSDKLLSFWQWSSSELVGNTLRGILADYLVFSALGCVSAVRQEWDAYDLETPNRVKVKVKLGAYLQNWSQTKLSAIKFGIKPTYGWDSKTDIRSGDKKRRADVYVFCVLNHKEKKTVNPMNLAQWDFYVISTTVLDKKVKGQVTISLFRLMTIGPIKTEFGKISKAIKQVLK